MAQPQTYAPETRADTQPDIEKVRAIILSDDEAAIKALSKADVEPLYEEIISAAPDEEEELFDVIAPYIQERHPDVSRDALPDWFDRYSRVFEVHQGTFLTSAELEAQEEAMHRAGDPEYLGEQAERAFAELEEVGIQDGREEASTTLANQAGIEFAEAEGIAAVEQADSYQSRSRTFGIETRADALATLTDDRTKAFGFDRSPEELDNWKTENLLNEARSVAAHKEAVRTDAVVSDLRSRVYDKPLHQRIAAGYVLSQEVQQGIGATVGAVGIDPYQFEERMRRGAPSRDQEVSWAADDITAVATHHNLDLLKDDDLQEAIRITRETHNRVADQVMELQRRLDGPAQESDATQELRRSALTAALDVQRLETPVFETDERARGFLIQVGQHYDREELTRVAQGDTSVLNDLTSDEATQKNIALGVLALAQKHPDILVLPDGDVSRGLNAYRAELRQSHEADGHSL